MLEVHALMSFSSNVKTKRSRSVVRSLHSPDDNEGEEYVIGAE